MSNHPLAEVFGYPIANTTAQARHYREKRLCPYNNKVPSCTKDKARNPLGVCSVYDDCRAVITCPIRFRQDWIIAGDAAEFFFPDGTQWTSLMEVRLNDSTGRSAGNIDIVLVGYDDTGCVTDFGALEVQAVYISGNVRQPFEHFMSDPPNQQHMDWRGQENYPRPDYLSSSRKRLAPQLIYKGGILHAWKKKIAVAVDRYFFASLPLLPETDPQKADIAWLVYDLGLDEETIRFNLVQHQVVYTSFGDALDTITTAEPGPIEDFLERLQSKLDERLETGYAPSTPTLADELRNGES